MKASRRKAKAAGRNATAGAAARQAGGERWWAYAIGFAAALGAVFWVYQPSLSAPFVLDDLYLPFLAPNFPSALRVWISGFRPMLMLTYWFNFEPGSTVTDSYHIWNLMLHWLNGVVVFFLVRRFLDWAGTAKDRALLLAAFASGLFLLHPVQTESVAYIAGRSELLSVLFFNAALAVFLWRRARVISWRATAGVLLLYGCAVLTKEHTAVFPALLLLTDYFWNPGFTFEGMRRNVRLYAPLAGLAVLGGAFVYRTLRLSPTAGFRVQAFTPLQYFLTECRVIWRYIALFLIPAGQNLDPDIAVSRGFSDPLALLGLAALLAATLAAWVWRRKFPLAAFGWFMTLLLLAPTSSFLPIRDVYAERRLYLPFVGLLLIACEFLRRAKLTTHALTTALAAVLLAEGVLTYERGQVWATPIALWQDTAAKSPHKVRPNFQLAKAYFDAGDCTSAAQQYAKTAAIAPPDFTLLVDWGLALDCAHQPDEAVARLRQAAAAKRPPQVTPAYVYSQIAKVYGTAGRFPEALAALDQGQMLDPNYDMLYFYRGTVFYKQGELAQAEEQYKRAVQLNPNNQASQNALAVVERALARPH
jgi:tetratricopeptide (TPR) repeat protein